MHKVRSELRAQAYTGTAQGMDLRLEFEREDRDKSGSLDKEEFDRALRKLVKLTDREFLAVWRTFDCDSSGSIQYEEFLNELDDGQAVIADASANAKEEHLAASRVQSAARGRRARQRGEAKRAQAKSSSGATRRGEPVSATVSFAGMTLQEFGNEKQRGFRSKIATMLASQLSVPFAADSVEIVRLSAGSVVIEFAVWSADLSGQ